MKFLRNLANTKPINDTVFAVAKLAKADIAQNGPDNVTNSTLGTLYDENMELVALDSVFNSYNNISNRQKASYASSFIGNNEYLQSVDQWLFSDLNLTLEHATIATIGGSGAISTAFLNTLDANETVIIPDIAWGSYQLMAQQYSLNVATYQLFEENNFNLKDFKETCLKVSKTQDKLLIVINDPCQNPTGYSMSIEEWEAVIAFVNELSQTVPCIILNDIAYIDYAFNQDARKYMEVFNKIADNVAIFIAFSTSKTLTSYGLRCGALILLTKQESDLKELFIVYEKTARSVWSNVPNAAMINFANIATKYRQEFLAEKAKYVDLLAQRSALFIKEAKECQLPIYNYREGFFVTVKVDNETRDKLHELLLAKHIYTVKTNRGIRIAICSLPLAKIKNLAAKINDCLKAC